MPHSFSSGSFGLATWLRLFRKWPTTFSRRPAASDHWVGPFGGGCRRGHLFNEISGHEVFGFPAAFLIGMSIGMIGDRSGGFTPTPKLELFFRLECSGLFFM